MRIPPDSHSPAAAIISGIARASSRVGTAVSLVAKYTFAEPRYWAIASQPMRVTESTPAIVYRDCTGPSMRTAPVQMRPSATAATKGRTADSNAARYAGICGVMA